MRLIILVVVGILILTGCRNPSAPENGLTNSESEADTMAWTTPKTDWKAGDRPTPADFNRGESNTQEAYDIANDAKYWAQLTTISARAGVQTSVGSESEEMLQIIRVGVKPMTYLKIRFISFNLNNDNLLLRVKVGGAGFESLYSAGHFDCLSRASYNETLYFNNTSSVEYKDVVVAVYNLGSIMSAVPPEASWMIQLEGAITYEDEAPSE